MVSEREHISKARLVVMSICIAGVFIDWGLLLSLLPPFYPTEAEKKGATPSQFGFVFGAANLAAFLSAPLFAKFGDQIGPKLLINIGGFVQGFAGIAFSFLDLIPNTTLFLVLSYFLRFLDGIADAAAWGAIIAIMMKLFPDKVATVASWTETFFGLGYTIGPAIGSVLYEAGGFQLPFLIVGSIGLFFAATLVFLIPNINKVKANPEPNGKISSENEPLISINNKKKNPLTLKSAFKYPDIFIPFVDDCLCFVGFSFLESMLEPHMKDDAGTTQFQVSMNFLTIGGVYMFATPLAGLIGDRIKYPMVMSIFGNAFMAVGLLLIGPAPFIPFEPSFSSIIGASALIGMSYAVIMVSTFARSFRATIARGFDDDIATYLMVSGLWSSSFYFGCFLGPTIGGFLVESLGFRTSCLIFMALNLIMCFVDSFEMFTAFNKNKKKSAEKKFSNDGESESKHFHEP